MIVKSIRALVPLIGRSHTTLNRAFMRGRFAEEPGGGFNPDKVRAALARSADPSQPPKASKPGKDATFTDEITGTAYEIFIKARAAKELAIAKERQLNLKKRQGELLETDDVKRTWTNACARFESRLFQLPDILAPRIAAMDDVLEVRALIMAEVRAALRALYSEESEDARP